MDLGQLLAAKLLVEVTLIYVATFNLIIQPVIGWMWGCRLNQAAIKRDGPKARRAFFWWFVSAVTLAMSVHLMVDVVKEWI